MTTENTDAAGDWPDFNKVDWDDLYPRLLLLTVGKMRRRRHQEAGVLGDAESSMWRTEVQDALETAILKAMKGEYPYDPGKSLFQNLAQIINEEAIQTIDRIITRLDVDIPEAQKNMDALIARLRMARAA